VPSAGNLSHKEHRMKALRLFAATVAVASTALAVGAGPSVAKQARVTGKLNKPGHTLVALAGNGKATSVRAKGSFTLVLPPGRVTLHLRAKSGVYAGPIVVRGSRRKAILGVRGGARLGVVAVKRGYARPRRALPARFVNRSITAKARKGLPVGAVVFGRVKAKAGGASGSGRDQDRDGIPGAFDVDDDGDLVLDNIDRGGAHTAQAAPAEAGFRVFSNLKLPLESSINANTGSVTDGQIDGALDRWATLAIQVPAGDEVELDCLGLAYCAAGGTGQALEGGAFPGDYDADTDGFGAIFRGTTGDFQLGVGATAAQIGSGDAFIQHVTSGTTTTYVPGILNYMFATTPALVRWADGSGASGSTTYPASPGSTGTAPNPISLTAGADGHVVATLTFWRPQRKAIAGSGEGTGWIDIGGLGYSADIPNGPSAGGPGAPGGAGRGRCDAGAYGTVDAGMAVTGDQVLDAAADRPADPANQLTFSVDITRCLTNGGVTWNPGETLAVDIQARSNYGDNAAQKVFFRR
jgi:hypothetical protein